MDDRKRAAAAYSTAQNEPPNDEDTADGIEAGVEPDIFEPLDLDATEPSSVPPLPPRSSLRNARSGATVRAAIAVALLSLCLYIGPGFALGVLPFICVPGLLLTLRFGPAPTLAIGIAAAIWGSWVGWDNAGAGGAAAGAVLGIGVVTLPALAIANTGPGRGFAGHPYAATCGAYTLVAVAVLGITLAAAGPHHIRASFARTIAQGAAAQRKELNREDQRLQDFGSKGASEDACDDIPTALPCVILRNADVEHATLRPWTFVVLAALLAVYAQIAAAIALWAGRTFATARQLRLQPPRGIIGFRVHWSQIYLAAIGIIGVGLWEAGTYTSEWLQILAVTALAFSVLPLIVQGTATAVMIGRLARVRRWVGVVLWIIVVWLGLSTLHGLEWSVGVLAGIGVIEEVIRLRQRTIDKINSR